MAALEGAPRPGQPPKLNAKQAAQITAIACSKAPDGHTHWTLRLLADQVVQLGFAVLSKTVFKKRIPDKARLENELDAICAERNAQGIPVKWVFTTEKARQKMHSGYEVLTQKLT